MKYKLIAAAIVLTAAIGMALSSSAPVYACTPGTKILTFPCWYDGLGDPPVIKNLQDIWKIALNIIDMAIQAIGYIAAVFILWGGFKFMLSEGNSDQAAGARRTIINASVGLIIALASIAIIRFVWALTT